MYVISGVVVLAVVAALFWYSLPSRGQVRPFVGTWIEPYVTVAITLGLVVAVVLVVLGLAGFSAGSNFSFAGVG